MSPDALAKARRLRRDETKAEQAAWNLLRNRQRLGHKFRRQQPVGKRVADFCCFELRLIIELDGSVHAQPSQTRRDESRDRELRAQGFKVLHFSNGLALSNPEGFVAKVEAAIAALGPSPPSPPPQGGRGEGSREGAARRKERSGKAVNDAKANVGQSKRAASPVAQLLSPLPLRERGRG